MNPKNQKTVCVGDIIEIMEDVAPPHLAEAWDNCGLQVGHMDWPVSRIWVALDPLLPVIRSAGQRKVDLLITHHPLIFKPLSRIDVGTVTGETIAAALQHQTAIYAAHTNLDSASGGINDILARKIGLTDLKPLMLANMDDAPDGLSEYSRSSGLGRIGKPDTPMTLEKLARQVKAGFELDGVKVAGDLGQLVRSVAVCSGSGGSLLGAFLESDADVFISGDLKYHDAREVEDAGRSIIDVGHFASEHLMVDPLVKRLDSAIQSKGWSIGVEACTSERDPFNLV